MKVERTSPIIFLLLGIWIFFKTFVLGCLGRLGPLRDLCYRILDFDCQETSAYVRHITLKELFPNADISEVTVFTPLNKGVATMSFDETVYLSALVKCVKPEIIFEIGTFRGYTTRAMARHAPDNCQIYTLDLPPEDFGKSDLCQHSADYANVLLNPRRKPTIGDLYRGDPIASRQIIQLLGSSDRFDYTPYLKKVDLYLIDGAHSYDFVMNDTTWALRCLSERGIVVWHDLKGGFRGMIKFFKEFGLSHLLFHLIGTSLVLYSAKPLMNNNTFNNN